LLLSFRLDFFLSSHSFIHKILAVGAEAHRPFAIVLDIEFVSLKKAVALLLTAKPSSPFNQAKKAAMLVRYKFKVLS
jgi:hypothetical protein